MHCNSELFMDVVKADSGIAAAGCVDCWTSQVKQAMQSLPADASGCSGARLIVRLISWKGGLFLGKPLKPGCW